jgi:hypothetical protein
MKDNNEIILKQKGYRKLSAPMETKFWYFTHKDFDKQVRYNKNTKKYVILSPQGNELSYELDFPDLIDVL